MKCEVRKLKDLLRPKGYIRGPFGSALKRGELQKSGIPVYEQQHAIYGTRTFRFYVGQGKYQELKRFTTEENDLIISCSGTIGKVSVIQPNDPTGIISQALLILRCNTNIVLPRFLYYFLSSARGYHSITSVSSGSVQVNIAKREVIENIDVPYFELQVQNKIVSVLQGIDDKIELNNKINENLEQQAQALYKAMFIDNPYVKTTEGVLSDIAEITMGQSPTGSSYNEEGNGEVFYQGRAEFGFRFPTRRLFTTEPKRMAETNDVLLSVRAPVGDLNVAYEQCCVGRGLSAIHSKDGNSSFLLYTMFALKPQLDIFNGEGTVFGSINKHGLSDLPVNIPCADEIAKFESLVRPMDDLIRTNYEENCRLQTLRDSLLPKLMNGEIDL